MLRPAAFLILLIVALFIVGLTLVIGVVAAVKLTLFVGLSIVLASTLVALSPNFQNFSSDA